MKLHFVEEMDEVLQIALEEKLPELAEETPDGLAASVLPADGSRLAADGPPVAPSRHMQKAEPQWLGLLCVPELERLS